MRKRVTVTCTECGAKHRVLRNRLGQERPCPKCGITFVLDEESNRSTYDLNVKLPGGDQTPTSSPQTQWDDDDFAADPQDDAGQPHRGDAPVLRRGTHRTSSGSRSDSHGGSGSGVRFQNKPLLIVAGLIVCALLGVLLHFLVSCGGEPATPPSPAETVP